MTTELDEPLLLPCSYGRATREWDGQCGHCGLVMGIRWV